MMWLRWGQGGGWIDVAVDDRSDEAAYPWRTQDLSPVKRKVVPIHREAAFPGRDRQHRVQQNGVTRIQRLGASVSILPKNTPNM